MCQLSARMEVTRRQLTPESGVEESFGLEMTAQDSSACRRTPGWREGRWWQTQVAEHGTPVVCARIGRVWPSLRKKPEKCHAPRGGGGRERGRQADIASLASNQKPPQPVRSFIECGLGGTCARNWGVGGTIGGYSSIHLYGPGIQHQP